MPYKYQKPLGSHLNIKTPEDKAIVDSVKNWIYANRNRMSLSEFFMEQCKVFWKEVNEGKS